MGVESEKSPDKLKDMVALAGPTVLSLLLVAGGLGLFLDIVHSSMAQGCLPGFTFYVPIAATCLLLTAFLVGCLGIRGKWLFGLIVFLFSLPIANGCALLTYWTMKGRCEVGSHFGMILIYALPIATVLGIWYAWLIIGRVRKILQGFRITRKKRFVFVLCILLFLFVLVMTSFPGLSITPKIRGMVVDAATLKPVGNAWVRANFVYKYGIGFPIDPPHTRTDGKGRFEIPLTTWWGHSLPFRLWRHGEAIYVKADTLEDKFGSVRIDNAYNLKIEVEITVRVEPWQQGLNNEREYFSYLRSLTNYCSSGRYEEKVGKVLGGCDDWEKEFVIEKYERYLERYQNDPKSGYFSALEWLAELYEKKKNYEKAIENYKKRISFLEKNGYSGGLWDQYKKGAEYHIDRLKKLM